MINTETGEVMEPRYLCTVDTSTFEGKKALVNARNSAISLASIGNKPLDIVGVYTTAGVRTQSGQPCTNVYLFTADGGTYFSQSDGINRSVIDIAEMFPDFNAANGGIKVHVKQTKLQNGNSIKSLEIM